jgi:hypothetical protein
LLLLYNSLTSLSEPERWKELSSSFNWIAAALMTLTVWVRS